MMTMVMGGQLARREFRQQKALTQQDEMKTSLSEQAEQEDTQEEEQHLVLHLEIVAAPVALGNLEQWRCEEAHSKWHMRGDESRGN
eukprot:2022328-Rhodomonas_salina.2